MATDREIAIGWQEPYDPGQVVGVITITPLLLQADGTSFQPPVTPLFNGLGIGFPCPGST